MVQDRRVVYIEGDYEIITGLWYGDIADDLEWP